MDERTMTQTAPYPVILEELVARLEYRPGWRFGLEDSDRGQGSAGLTFTVVGRYPDTYNPGEMIRVAHPFPVPPAAFNERSWRRWIFDRLLEVDRHEAAEFFVLRDDAGEPERPYAPHHGPGNDPYVIFEQGDDLERRTRFDGTVAPA